MRKILCKGGQVIEVIDDDHWIVPTTNVGTPKHRNIDFTRLPNEVRSWWRSLVERTYQNLSPRALLDLWNTALLLTRFQQQNEAVMTTLDNFASTDWWNYAEWLKTQRGYDGKGKFLSIQYRKLQFVRLIFVAKQAMMLHLPGVSEITIERLHSVTRNGFKEKNSETLERIQQRALSSEQYTDLYAMMAEEWQCYLERESNPKRKVNLPALVACWLAFNDGVRHVEINTLTINDVQADPSYGKHRLYLHATNKEPDTIPIEKDTLLLLQTMIDEGTEIRTALGTNLLFVGAPGHSSPHILNTTDLNRGIRNMIGRHKYVHLPSDLKISDGRITLATHLTYVIRNRERVRHIMRHAWATTTETYYRAQQELVVAGNIANALRAESWRLTIACQRPIVHISERPEQVDILARNPGNAELEWGSCGRDVERQGGCRFARHCFECPLLVPWASKRYNFVAERDEYVRLAGEAKNNRDRENLLYHAHQAEAYIILIDRCKEEEEKNNAIQTFHPTRQRRPRQAGHSPLP